jgi:hypothetical protein
MDMGGAAATLGAVQAFGETMAAGAAPTNPRFTKVSFVLALAENARCFRFAAKYILDRTFLDN